VISVPLTLRRLHRIVVERPAAGQPSVWTLIDFTCVNTDTDTLAEQLAASLNPGPWYVDVATSTTKYVIFASFTDPSLVCS
jgi:hypothetical protein